MEGVEKGWSASLYVRREGEEASKTERRRLKKKWWREPWRCAVEEETMAQLGRAGGGTDSNAEVSLGIGEQVAGIRSEYIRGTTRVGCFGDRAREARLTCLNTQRGHMVHIAVEGCRDVKKMPGNGKSRGGGEEAGQALSVPLLPECKGLHWSWHEVTPPRHFKDRSVKKKKDSWFDFFVLLYSAAESWALVQQSVGLPLFFSCFFFVFTTNSIATIKVTVAGQISDGSNIRKRRT